ncbi:hypothetical protein V2J09_014417 [Rumex salicifolius]
MEETFLRSPTIIRNSISTTLRFYLPVSRYIAGDYADLRSDDEDYDYEEARNDGGGDTEDDDYGAWRPLLVLDVLWNLAFVLVSVAALCWTVKEKPLTPLRVWIGGYGLQCLLHVGFVYSDYRRKLKMESYGDHLYGGASSSHNYYFSIMKKLETVNTLASSFWWVLGFYWIVGGGPSLLIDAPCLYWLAVVYLALDIFFMVLCIGIACIICLAFFFCIPVAAIAYAMTIKEGASEDDIGILPKYRFSESFTSRTSDKDLKHCGIALHSEDCECCICLTQYVEGAELCTLPCNHHFHHNCISKWLRINATCPLCKFNILKGDQAV